MYIYFIQEQNKQQKQYLEREVRLLAKLKSDYVVQYLSSWFEDNELLYIQMELFSDNLKNIIEEMPKCFKRQSSEALNSIEFFISCQLFRELLECVKYLHESNPQIIHRDLKPANILINKKPINGRFLKLCDLGFAIEHEWSKQSHTNMLGSPKYMAPEVRLGEPGRKIYTTKADIYSLGILIQQLFDLKESL